MNKNHSKLQESNIIYSSLFNLSLNIMLFFDLITIINKNDINKNDILYY